MALLLLVTFFQVLLYEKEPLFIIGCAEFIIQ